MKQLLRQSDRRVPRRWTIAAAGTVLMLCLGTVYAWSFFQDLLVRGTDLGWTNSQVAWIFSLAIFFLGATAAWGGVALPRIGPKRMAMIGGVLFSLGYVISGVALRTGSLALLYIGYGFVGGTGLGLGYVTPVATVAKWFPDKRGFATGMVVMGFGLGALLMSKILAPLALRFTGGDLAPAFVGIGGLFFVLTVGPAAFLRNPPAGWRPKTNTPAAAPGAGAPEASASSDPLPSARAAVVSGRFVLIWIMFFCNITAGISIISFQSPLFQSLLSRADPAVSAAALAGLGASLIAISSLFNGAGRFLWGAVSDRLGGSRAFSLMVGSEILVFGALIFIGNPWVFGAMVCWVLLCYGGGFGIMPSLIGDEFGQRIMASVYGVVLTAWAAAGIVGPQIVAVLKDRIPDRVSFYSFLIGAGFLALGFAVSLAASRKGRC